ncbi:Mediator of RNA polymerase II transcription subunit 7 [Knufia obscura]|uniref:Mediator of RNA polymerase II transcription subunit 7 n=2 Tax=Knufia TaxID=430999 RepID=A0AAN8EBQ2_9EURO|nr:Mediator of RNA polymerase II transcription subunit 7 [Knufia obscura]KAK5950275.1 Mediator of RNA polymerase II transcription subunit 7 [Knufia fluminis]
MAQQPVDLFYEQLSAPYPPPPPLWKHFTTTNLDRLKDLKSQPAFDDTEPASLPYELRVLRPPPPPRNADSYTTFQTQHAIPPAPTLPPEHEELLFDPTTLTSATGTARPHAKLLWQLIKSLNLNFLELYTVMADNPADWEEKVRDIGMLLENINAVLNLLRPHQAREGVKTMLLNRLEAGREEMERCDKMNTQVEQFLRDVADEEKMDGREERADGVTNGVNGVNGVHKQEEAGTMADMGQERRNWDMLDGLDGD